jgi:hypothetical protein
MQRQTHWETLGGHQHETSINRCTNLVVVTLEFGRDPEYPIGRGVVSYGTQSRRRSRHERSGRGTQSPAHRYVCSHSHRQRAVTHCMTRRNQDAITLTLRRSMITLVIDGPGVRHHGFHSAAQADRERYHVERGAEVGCRSGSGC